MMIRFTTTIAAAGFFAAFLAIASSSIVAVVEAHLRKGNGGNGGHQHHHRHHHRRDGSDHPQSGRNDHHHNNGSLRGGAAGQQLQPSSSFTSLMKPRSEVTDEELLQEQMLLNLELDRYNIDDSNDEEEQEETQLGRKLLAEEEENRALLQAELDLLDASHDDEMHRQREHHQAKQAEEDEDLARSNAEKQEIENEIQTMIESYAKRLDLIKRLDLEIKNSQPQPSYPSNNYAERLEQIKQEATAGESMIGEEEIREAAEDPFVREELARRADRENDARLYELVEDDKLDRIAAESMLEAQMADQIQENNEIALDNDHRDSEQLLHEEQELKKDYDNDDDLEDEISRMEIERERRLMESAMAIVEESRRD